MEDEREALFTAVDAGGLVSSLAAGCARASFGPGLDCRSGWQGVPRPGLCTALERRQSAVLP